MSDVVGLVTGLDEAVVVLERRGGTVVTIARGDVVAARVVPLVARGRNPRHFDPDQVRELAHDAGVGGSGPVWVGRLAELVTSLDTVGVVDGDPARSGGSVARVFGEWAAVRLEAPEDLPGLAAWAARHDARNIAVTGPGTKGVQGLERL
ncbi:hypothetical protein GCM10028815_03530 [Mariniluteicoccus flavus]